MSNNLLVFGNDFFGNLEYVMVDDEPWFVASSVAKAIEHTDLNRLINRAVEEEDRMYMQFETNGGVQTVLTVNESGLYSIALSSKVEKARPFKIWVTKEVIPSIRKYGAYATPATIENVLNDPDFGIRLLTELKNERMKREEVEKENVILLEDNEMKQKEIEEMKPKVSYYDIILNSDSAVSTTLVAKDYGMSAIEFNKLLASFGIQYKQGSVWYLYAKYQNKGYTQSKTTPNKKGFVFSHTCWTQKGRVFLYNFLKEHGILPVIEREEEK